MYKRKKIRVLVIDDSILFREAVASALGNDDGIEVVGTAPDPYIARDKILELEPDVLTLDVEMPKMNGIDFLKKLMPQYPLPVVVCSAVSNNVFEALDAGAVDFVTKPTTNKNMDSFINELIIKVKIASIAKVGHMKRTSSNYKFESEIKTDVKIKLIAIGASTGGTEAIFDIISAFPKNMPGIVIVQHMPALFTDMYAKRLNNACKLEVREAEDGDEVLSGRVLIAPGGDRHTKVISNGNRYFIKLYKSEKVNGHCPSVDVLFDSVADNIGKNALGVILTGMGFDGAKGLLKMKKNGAITIGQDEQSSVVYGMPKVAFDLGAVDKQVDLKNIPQLIYSMVCKND